MNGLAWFMLAARAFGLWVLYNGISHLSVVVEHMFRIEQPERGSFAPGTYLLHACWHLGMAGVLLLKTRTLARIICSDDEPDAGVPAGPPVASPNIS